MNLKTGLKKNTWQSFDNHSVTLTNNVFGDATNRNLQCTMLMADGEKVKLSVTAKKVENDDERRINYGLKHPMQKAISRLKSTIMSLTVWNLADYIATTMKVVK